MKKIYYLAIAALLFSGCEDFLDTQSYTKKNTGNFPANPQDAEQMITGIYSMLYGVTEDQTPSKTTFMVAEIASDDRLAGGAMGRDGNQAVDHLMWTNENFFGTNLWDFRYRGIFRANTALETLDNVEGWASEQDLITAKAEASFLRAYYFFDLSQIYGEIPLTLKSEPENLPQSLAEETYAVISSDLKNAIEWLPSVKQAFPSNGHVTKWAAEALMARVFLFYTGYYEKDALPLPEGGSITKDQIITWIDDCVNNSGHGLVSDFRNLWPYSNQWTAKDYPYAQDNNLHWEGDGNKEEVFSIRFSSLVGWDGNNAGQKLVRYSNQYCLYFGLPSGNGDENTFPFGMGWGAAPVNPQLWNQWKQDEPNDIRRGGSIIEFETDLPNLDPEPFKNWMEATGYWQKKYIGINAHNDDNKLVPYSTLLTGHNYSNQLDHTQDLMLIRFADVLLMQSELKQDPAGLNNVRRRAGLPLKAAYSLADLKKERRYELAFEGLRWFDLMRWHDAADALEGQIGAPIVSLENNNAMKDFGIGYRKRYEQTGGFWPIERTQLDLSEGVLKQNKGWDTPDADYWGW
ncbi:MAG: RagB/SusD family nutrient uptake outer membrane protein [Mediterranea sp.]|jgi:hypothetical protein|nr:RagB/SusD family nutrient uptake outer membrane protein [Mediterranea sp.]